MTDARGSYRRVNEAVSAEEDYDVEENFAAKLVSGEATIEQFPYYADYKTTVDAEIRAAGGTSNALWVGGGPVPISAIILSKEGLRVSVLELMQEAVHISKQVIDKLRLRIPVRCGDGATFDGYGNFDLICIALEAGNTRERKEAIFAKINEHAKPGSSVLVRGSSGSDAFVNVDDFVRDHFEVVAKVPVFSGLSTSYVLHCRTKGARGVDKRMTTEAERIVDRLLSEGEGTPGFDIPPDTEHGITVKEDAHGVVVTIPDGSLVIVDKDTDGQFTVNLFNKDDEGQPAVRVVNDGGYWQGAQG